MAARRDIVQRGDSLSKEENDLKNKWRWQWMEEKVDEERIGSFIRKVEGVGVAYCLVCRREIHYRKRGKVALTDHIKCCNQECCLNLIMTLFRLSTACLQDLLHPFPICYCDNCQR